MNTDAKPSSTNGAAYIRVSDGEKQDPQRQRDEIAAWAAKRGLTITHWYEDVHGRNSRDRSETRANFQRLIKDVQAGRVPWVVVQSLDRWGTAKHNHEFGYFATILLQNDCQLWSATQGHLTAPDAATAFSTTAQSVTASEDLIKLGRNQISGKRTKAKQGEWQGGYIPYGFDVVCQDQATGVERWRVVVLQMVPTKKIWNRVRIYPNGTEERCDGRDRFPRKQDWEVFKLAPSVKTDRVTIAQEIFKLFASGAWTVRGLCKRLNERKIDPVTGEGWYQTRLTPMLKNPAYHVGNTVWGKNSHGKNAQYIEGEYSVPPTVKGKTKMGRKNAKTDWVFPPTTTAIVEKSIWEEVQTRLTSKKATIKRGLRDERLWLAGLLVCHQCGQKMTGWSQGGPHYACTTYRKFGKNNPTNCKLNRVHQDRVVTLINSYLEAIAPDVRELLATKDNPALLTDVHAKLASREQEVWNVFGAMREYVRGNDRDRELIRNRRECSLEDILNDYRAEYDHDRDRLQAELTAKEDELTTLITNINRLPASAKNALAVQQKLIAEADAEVTELRAKLVPLVDQLDAAYSDLQALDNDLTAALKAAPGDDARRKALTLRKVVERVVLHFSHTERPAIDRRSKNPTVTETVLAKAEFVPVTGQTFTMNTVPARG